MTDLTAILRDLSQQQATGRLIVRFPGTLASIYLVAGGVVHATLGFNKGPEVFAVMLQMTLIRSEFRANLPAPETTIRAPLESLLTTYAPGKAKAVGATDAADVREGAVTPPEQHVLAEPLTKAPQPAQLPPEGDLVPVGFAEDLNRVLIYLMGPIGTIILEDAQADLQLRNAVPKAKVQTLIAEITRQLGAPARQQAFGREVAALLARYDLGS